MGNAQVDWLADIKLMIDCALKSIYSIKVVFYVSPIF